KGAVFRVTAWVLGGLSLTSAQAATVSDPDQNGPTSRFGEYTDRAAIASKRHQQFRDDDREDADSPVADKTIARRRPSRQIASEGQDSSGVSDMGGMLGTTRRNGVQEVAMIAGDLGFFPKTLFVTKDIPVRLFVTGASKQSLCVMMDSFQVRKQVRSQSIEELSFTPEIAGKFRFYCPINGAEGSLIVREFERGEES
ncbi:MAG: Cupredoxin-like domain, partial [Pseudomonadota bacterium]